MNIPKVIIHSFQKEILSWYEENKQNLPWRNITFDTISRSRDPYKILVSEVMLQQTQVSRVIPKYNTWLQKFPTVHDLALASTADVLTYWSGLGYNRRALNLKKTAEEIVTKYNGVFPSAEDKLLKLPGIGKYTARAILCFAFEQQLAVVDTNVRKVILTRIVSHLKTHEPLYVHDDDTHMQTILSEKDIEYIADQLLPQGKAYTWNQALMDYSREMLKKEKIIIPKQSKFLGSRRYYRGQVIKILIEQKKISKKNLIILLMRIDPTKEEIWIKGLLNDLLSEHFIELTKGHFVLAS